MHRSTHACSHLAGVPSTPTAVMTYNDSISISWNQQNQDVVTRYEINYSYTVNHCPQYRPVQNTIVNVSGSMRIYTLLNTSENPIEEDSIYTITITAINPAGRSRASTGVLYTLPSGGCLLCFVELNL